MQYGAKLLAVEEREERVVERSRKPQEKESAASGAGESAPEGCSGCVGTLVQITFYEG